MLHATGVKITYLLDNIKMPKTQNQRSLESKESDPIDSSESKESDTIDFSRSYSLIATISLGCVCNKSSVQSPKRFVPGASDADGVVFIAFNSFCVQRNAVIAYTSYQ